MRIDTFPGLPLIQELAHLYEDHGHELTLTGGAVRDHLLGRPYDDIDLLSDARPDQSADLLREWASLVRHVANPFGVVECDKAGFHVQVITYRTLDYRYDRPDGEGGIRGSTIEKHLACHDFTMNTIAVRLPSLRTLNPFNGIEDLCHARLRTPVDPEVTIERWPATMLRVGRFAAELDFDPCPELLAAMRTMASTIAGELPYEAECSLRKIIGFTAPHKGVAVLRETGVLGHLPRGWQDKLNASAATPVPQADVHIIQRPGDCA